jgi:trigger factor
VTHQDFHNDRVKVHVRKSDACQVEMTVKGGGEVVKAARKQAMKVVGKEVSLPGFRKGKAPDDMILKKFGAEIEKQLHKEVADVLFVDAQTLAKVTVLNQNSPVSFDLKGLTDESVEAIFSFETEPTIPKVDAKGFVSKPVKRAEVADKQLDEAVRQMRFFYAHWKPVHDRPVQDGDYIMINLDTIEGEEVQNVFHHIRFEVSKERMAEWMKKLVAGARAGDVLEGMSEVDETASEEEKKEFKPKKVRLTVLKVEEAMLPELDDEFAKKVGAHDVAHMRQSIASLLNKQADEKVRTELREQVNDYLVDGYQIDLPRSLIEAEKKHRLNQLTHDPNFKAGWQKMSQQERNTIDEKLTQESAQAVKLFYLSRQVVRDEQIPITHKEVQDEAISLYQAHGNRQVEIDQMPKEVYALALSKVILAKAQDHLINHQKT